VVTVLFIARAHWKRASSVRPSRMRAMITAAAVPATTAVAGEAAGAMTTAVAAAVAATIAEAVAAGATIREATTAAVAEDAAATTM